MRLFLMLVLAAAAQGQQHELGLTMGRLNGPQRSSIDSKGGLALQASYGYRLTHGDRAALYLESTALANPLREIRSSNQSVTRDYASLLAVTGFRLKLFPESRLAPYALIGGGLAWFEQSTTVLNGAPNPAPRNLVRGAFTYGAGIDVRIRRWLALRGEVRDFYTGSPTYNIPISGGQHNLALTGGFVLRWGK